MTYAEYDEPFLKSAIIFSTILLDFAQATKAMVAYTFGMGDLLPD
ncbi:MAG: hypothetical protein NWQ92_08105 [Sphingorhabdus sp.]|nr:hypothetical protein [Sphingorhabdus sp.]MDP4873359.1 hypothetical protein [Sphingorhabdus sp.]